MFVILYQPQNITVKRDHPIEVVDVKNHMALPSDLRHGNASFDGTFPILSRSIKRSRNLRDYNNEMFAPAETMRLRCLTLEVSLSLTGESKWHINNRLF
jgi:hypothetical protein